jgi:hypothetical protein
MLVVVLLSYVRPLVYLFYSDLIMPGFPDVFQKFCLGLYVVFHHVHEESMMSHTVLTYDALIRALALRDLTDPLQGPHALQ